MMAVFLVIAGGILLRGAGGLVDPPYADPSSPKIKVGALCAVLATALIATAIYLAIGGCR